MRDSEKILSLNNHYNYSFTDGNTPVSILYKSIAGRYRPVRVADGPITDRYRFIKNASWDYLTNYIEQKSSMNAEIPKPYAPSVKISFLNLSLSMNVFTKILYST